MFVVLAPGQGAQTPGLLIPWLDLPGAGQKVGRWSAATGLDLLRLGTTAGAEEIRDTAIAQPLLTAAALLSAAALLGDRVPDAVCGHSVGELAALAVAGVLDDDTAVRLAGERGAGMALAAARRPTGMSAVLGGELAAVAAAGATYGLSVATVNAPGQTVLGGPVEALAAFAAAPPARSRVRPLDVAGAFHTTAMQEAVPRFAAALAALAPGDPRCAVIANADGAVVEDGRALLDRLLGQLTSPVRFDLCLSRLADEGVTAVVELAPGGTLAGIVGRALPEAQVVALRTPDDIPAAQALATRHPVAP
ncbi:MAG: (acyl-carrier-protein) S-malonyltransferase-like protein [Mycobacterium sp.]|nr:(acyl-carrier-protein) S-malonyltransferase-like protein [Mycobacterium sp.]